MTIGFACPVKIPSAADANSSCVLFVSIMQSKIQMGTANVSKGITQTMANALNVQLLAQHALPPQIAMPNALQIKIQEVPLMTGVHAYLASTRMGRMSYVQSAM